jgi:hypothetical protein
MNLSIFFLLNILLICAWILLTSTLLWIWDRFNTLFNQWLDFLAARWLVVNGYYSFEKVVAVMNARSKFQKDTDV